MGTAAVCHPERRVRTVEGAAVEPCLWRVLGRETTLEEPSRAYREEERGVSVEPSHAPGAKRGLPGQKGRLAVC